MITENTTTPPAADPVPKKKSSKGTKMVACIVIGLAVFGISKAMGGDSSAAPSSSSSLSGAINDFGADHKVVYKVTGTTKQASITMTTGGGDTSQQSDVDVPLTSKSAGAEGLTQTMKSGQFFYISAQNSNDHGSITCSVEVDGVVVKTATSSGGYVIASCSGTV